MAASPFFHRGLWRSYVVLHNEMLRGDKAALALAIFIGVYWTARIAVDFTYLFLATTYISLLLWHLAT